MRKLVTTRVSFSRMARRWRAWRARLRQSRAAIPLLAILMLGLGEPLACILHCQIWLPFAFQSHMAAQQVHQHHQHHQHTAQPAAAPEVAHSRPADASTISICHFAQRGGGDVPFYVPPSPIHEMLPSAAMLLIVVLLISVALAPPPGDPPQVALPPPLRPPIPVAQ